MREAGRLGLRLGGGLSTEFAIFIVIYTFSLRPAHLDHLCWGWASLPFPLSLLPSPPFASHYFLARSPAFALSLPS